MVNKRSNLDKYRKEEVLEQNLYGHTVQAQPKN